MGSVVCFFTAVFSLLLFSGSTHSLTYLRKDVQDAEVYAAQRRRLGYHDIMILSARVTVLLLGVSIAEISAGAHRDLQTGSVGVVVEGKLQFSRHHDTLKDNTVCAVAAVAALVGRTQTESSRFTCAKTESLQLETRTCSDVDE